jgi:branched-chain amino acid transport system permease protein
MDAVITVLVSGLLMGSIYAVSAVGLSLVWGALGMLNMAHGILLTIGGYMSFSTVMHFGLPNWLGLPVACIISACFGLLIYYGIVKWMYKSPLFQTNVIVATLGLSMMLENGIRKIYGSYPEKQPFGIDRSEGVMISIPESMTVFVSDVFIPWQNFIIMGITALLILIISYVLTKTKMGRAIRATAQNRDAAQLNGVPVGRVFAQVLAIGGVVAAISGIMISSVASLAPYMGYDPMMKAFIICVVGGLGSVPGALYMALILGLVEAGVQLGLGARYGYPVLLIVVILALLWRPYGVFGNKEIARI